EPKRVEPQRHRGTEKSRRREVGHPSPLFPTPDLSSLCLCVSVVQVFFWSHTMKIRDVRVIGLVGGTVDGGWPQGNKPEEDLNTVREAHADGGPAGGGSSMTSRPLVAAAVELLRPHLIGERGDEPARVSEKLRQATFWQGRGGAVEHAISGIDIALWDLFGKATRQPVSRLLRGNYRSRVKPYGSIL